MAKLGNNEISDLYDEEYGDENIENNQDINIQNKIDNIEKILKEYLWLEDFEIGKTGKTIDESLIEIKKDFDDIKENIKYDLDGPKNYIELMKKITNVNNWIIEYIFKHIAEFNYKYYGDNDYGDYNVELTALRKQFNEYKNLQNLPIGFEIIDNRRISPIQFNEIIHKKS